MEVVWGGGKDSDGVYRPCVRLFCGGCWSVADSAVCSWVVSVFPFPLLWERRCKYLRRQKN